MRDFFDLRPVNIVKSDFLTIFARQLNRFYGAVNVNSDYAALVLRHGGLGHPEGVGKGCLRHSGGLANFLDWVHEKIISNASNRSKAFCKLKATLISCLHG